MNDNSWAVFDAVLFLNGGLLFSYFAIRYDTYKARRKWKGKPLPRLWFCTFALGSLLWGTGWLFHAYRPGVWENVFKGVGALLLVVPGVVGIAFLRKNRTERPAR